ncbi:CaiB/BaiF CoA transferase family protein [Halovenus marina]|uniref:CaiB/BaiF CoA transferase family protein n=1 Tax=Halovenus marina TaxID=3396621 RepID=UPI003F56D8DD
MNAPFEDITVVDLSSYVTGSFPGSMLAYLGAEVVKVEQPGSGDPNRDSAPFIEGESGYFWTVNYGKRSLELDLKSDRGTELFHELADEADVVLENFRPGVTERLGIDYESVAEHNPEVIYCSISGFGESGPLKDRPGYDLLMQGMSGIMSVTGEPDGRPLRVGIPLVDMITAMWAGFGVAGALYRRQETGEGDRIEIGMLDAAMPWLTKQAAKAFAGEPTKRLGTRDPVIAPYQIFETSDGYLALGVNQRQWKQLCDALDREDLMEDERFRTNEDRVEHVDELAAELERIFRERTTEEWIEHLTEDHGIPTGPVWSIEEVLESEHIDERGVIDSLPHTTAGEQPVINHPLNFENSSGGFERHAPVLGEHTREILHELGYDEETIEELYEDAVVTDEES